MKHAMPLGLLWKKLHRFMWHACMQRKLCFVVKMPVHQDAGVGSKYCQFGSTVGKFC